MSQHQMLMFRDEAAKNKIDRWDTQHIELVVLDPDPLSEAHDGRFFLFSPLMELSPMIFYVARWQASVLSNFSVSSWFV